MQFYSPLQFLLPFLPLLKLKLLNVGHDLLPPLSLSSLLGLRVGAQVFEQLSVQPLQDAVSRLAIFNIIIFSLTMRSFFYLLQSMPFTLRNTLTVSRCMLHLSVVGNKREVLELISKADTLTQQVTNAYEYNSRSVGGGTDASDSIKAEDARDLQRLLSDV